MRRIGFILVAVIIASMLASCGSREPVAEENQIVFEGQYISNDESVLTVTKNEETFAITIDITRLTWIDDGVGTALPLGDGVEFCATDASGNPISGTLDWQSPDEVILEFTESTWEYLPNGTVMKFWRGELNTTEEEEGAVEQTADLVPTAPIRFGVLDATFEGYRNKTGATFYEQSHENTLAPYYMKKTDGVRYYYGTNEVVIGVENDQVCVMTGFASDFVGHTSPRVRELINAFGADALLGADALFEIVPEVIEVNNAYNSKYFFYWRIENGYLGLVTIGGNNPKDCYNYVVNSFVFFEDFSVIHTVTEKQSESNGDTLKKGDIFTITGVVDYHEEANDIGENYCSIASGMKVDYCFTDMYGEEVAWSSDVFYTKGKESVPFKKYVGRQVSVSGVFDTDIHGIPYIINIEVLES